MKFLPPRDAAARLQRYSQLNQMKAKQVRDLVQTLIKYPWNSPAEKSEDLARRLSHLKNQIMLVLSWADIPELRAGRDGYSYKGFMEKERLIIENDEYNVLNPYRTSSGAVWQILEQQKFDRSLIIRENSYTLREDLLRQKKEQNQQVDLLTASLESLSTSDPTPPQELEAPQEQDQDQEKDTTADFNQKKEARKVRQAIRRNRQKARHGRR